MKNLAGNTDCDQEIVLELKRAKINIVQGERSNREVPASITGELKGFTFERAWYYWTVKGRLPLAVAQSLYRDPVGEYDVRINGDCGRPAPDATYASWYDSAGNRLLPFSEKKQFDSLRESGYLSPEYQNCSFVEDPSVVGDGFIESYHIDTEVGLRIFADALRLL